MDEGFGKIIYTIGHSTWLIEEFIVMLQSFGIKSLADIRSYPGSRHCPQFNIETLGNSLLDAGIKYNHLPKLGGRRKVRPDSVNSGWKNVSFRAYADYMQTDEFSAGIRELEEIALLEATAYMCSEALWWKCHRSMVSDYLKLRGWMVKHIMKAGKSDEHKYTSPARIEDGHLLYDGQALL